MPLQDFDNIDGSINAVALLEQSCMIECVSTNAQATLQVILNSTGGGEVLAFSYQPESYPPSWSLSRQGDFLILNVAGTVNALQWGGDVLGVFAAPNGVLGVRVHSFFYAAYQSLWASILPILPVGWETLGWKISGHSYGGAVAFLIAIFKSANYGGPVPQFIGSAAPKSITTGFGGVLPNPCFIVQNGLDVFPTVPPNGLLSVALAAVPFGTWAIPIDWTHYGSGVATTLLGNQDAQEVSYFDAAITPAALLASATDHYLTSYIVCAIAAVQRMNQTPYTTALCGLAIQLAQGKETQLLVTNAGALATVNVNDQNADTFLAPVNGPLNETNLPSVQSGTVTLRGVAAANSIFTVFLGGFSDMYKVTFFYSVNLAGFSETFYTSTAPGSSLDTQIVAYLTARLGISGAQCTIQYVRVSTVGSPRTVTIYTQNDLVTKGLLSLTGNFIYNRKAAPSDFGGTALMTRKFSNALFSRFFLRGVPDFMIENGGLYTPTATYTAAFQIYANALSIGVWSWKGVSTPLVGSPSPILGAAQQTDGTVIYTLQNPVFGTVPGVVLGTTRVAIRISGQTTPSYLNGPATVRLLTNTTCQTLRPTPLVGFVAGNGKMFVPNVVAFRVINRIDVEKVVKRGPGRPFGLYRGRSKNRLVG